MAKKARMRPSWKKHKRNEGRPSGSRKARVTQRS